MNVNANLKTFLSHLEIYLMDADSSSESRKNLRDIELVCEGELNGSSTLRDLHILVRIFL